MGTCARSRYNQELCYLIPVLPIRRYSLRSISRLLLIGGAAILLAGCGSEVKAPDTLETIARNREVHILTEGVNAPFEFGKGTGYQGMGADIGEEIAKTIGYPLRWVQPKNRGTAYLFGAIQEGASIDMIISSIVRDPQRAAEFDFSETYYDTGDVIAHHRTEFGITDLASLSGKKVGVVEGRPADAFMSSQTTASNVTLSRYSNADEALGYLNRREIDAVVGDEIPLNYSIVQNYSNINVLDTIINSYAYTVAVRKGDALLLEKVNETISHMKNSGELARLEEEWIGDIKDRARSRASADRQQEELKRAPKTINVTINKQSGSGSWSMERLDGFQLSLRGAGGSYQSTHILTDGNRGTCRFSQAVPPGTYTMDISILGLKAPVTIPEYQQTSLAMTVNIGSLITVVFK